MTTATQTTGSGLTGLTGRPTKLRDGTWGATVEGTAQVGSAVLITTSSGKSWTAEVTRVVWTGSGRTIVATRSLDRPVTSGRTRGRGTWTGCRCGSVEEYERDGDCRSCQHDR